MRASAICYALKKRKITRKKKNLVIEKGIEERIKYYQTLRNLIKVHGSKSLVFIDESGFEEFNACVSAWSRKGKKVYGDRQGKRGKRENLVAGRRKGNKDLMAPMVWERVTFAISIYTPLFLCLPIKSFK